MDPLFKYILIGVLLLTAVNLFMWGLLRRRISQADALHKEIEEEVKAASRKDEGKAGDGA